MAGSAIAYLVVGFLVILVVAVSILLYTSYRRLKKCMSTEHGACPSYFCSTTATACASKGTYGDGSGAAYRTTAAGDVQCQTPTITPTVTDWTPAQRSAWPR